MRVVKNPLFDKKNAQRKAIQNLLNRTKRLAFELKYSRRLFADYQKIDTSGMINYTFIDTTFDQISGYLNRKE